ncbi:hypothetical protein ACI65C_006028 [Semiaphis heraclei]
MKNPPEFDARTIGMTEDICTEIVQIIVGGTEPSKNTTVRNNDDLRQQFSHRQYEHRMRCSAGNDNYNAGRNNECNRNPQQQNGRPANNGRQPIWGDQDGARLPPLRLVFRDPSLAQSAQPTPSRIPVPCPCRSEPPRRQDRPVDLYTGSRLPVPNRPGRAPTRVPRNNDRRGTYDVQQPRPCPPAAVPTDRRGTYDVQPPPPGNQNSRRGTFTVQPEARDGGAAQDDRRGTYDVSRPCAAAQCSRRSSSNAQPQPTGGAGVGNATGSFMVTGTIRLDGFQGLSPVRPHAPRDRSSSGSRMRDTDGGINAFLENQLNFDTVAPRSMAVPGQPYVRIDETAGNTTPEQWRQMMDNRSSIGSQPMGIMSPTYDGYRGSRDTSTDSPRMQRWSSSDRQSRPFGLDDSFALSGASTPQERPSRARSAAPDCGPPVRKNRFRRDTFDRNTR